MMTFVNLPPKSMTYLEKRYPHFILRYCRQRKTTRKRRDFKTAHNDDDIWAYFSWRFAIFYFACIYVFCLGRGWLHIEFVQTLEHSIRTHIFVLLIRFSIVERVKTERDCVETLNNCQIAVPILNVMTFSEQSTLGLPPKYVVRKQAKIFQVDILDISINNRPLW